MKELRLYFIILTVVTLAQIISLILIPSEKVMHEDKLEVAIKYTDVRAVRNIDVTDYLVEMSIAFAKVTRNEVQQLQRNPSIQYIEENRSMNANTMLSDKVKTPITYNSMPQEISWNINYMNAPSAWRDSFTGKGIKVAILDTGIDIDHPDLKVSGGYSAVSYTSSYNDEIGHGTHVAGIIGARNNGEGVAGVAPDVDLYAVKVIKKDGSYSFNELAKGIYWAVNNKINVINMSLGSPTNSKLISDAIQYAVSRGVIVVAASGNESPTYYSNGKFYFLDGTSKVNYKSTQNNMTYPARLESTVAVSAIDQNLELASYSSTGPQVDFAAPGSDIPSTYKNGTYAYMSGTSMATPHVTGLLAILMQEYPEDTSAQILNRLKTTFANRDNQSEFHNSEFGYGMVAYTNNELQQKNETAKNSLSMIRKSNDHDLFLQAKYSIDQLSGLEREIMIKQYYSLSKQLKHFEMGMIKLTKDTSQITLYLEPDHRTEKAEGSLIKDAVLTSPNGITITPKLVLYDVRNGTANRVVLTVPDQTFAAQGTYSLEFKTDDLTYHYLLSVEDL